MELKAIPEISSFVKELAQAWEVEAVLCYGSYAAGLQDKKSDVDLLVILRRLPQPEELGHFYRNLPGFKASESHDIGHWNSSWTLLNTRLETTGGQKIDVGYNTASWLRKIVKKMVESHEIDFKELPFRPYTMLGLLENSLCLYDKSKLIAKIRSRIRPFPLELKKKIVQANLPMLRDNLEDLADQVTRDVGLLAYQFNIFMGLDAALQLLWVINDVYDPASKRSEAYLFRLKEQPPGFSDFINKSLPKCYEDRDRFVESFDRIRKYIESRLSDLGLD